MDSTTFHPHRQMSIGLIALVAVLLLFGLPICIQPAAAQGELGDMRTNVRTSSPSPPKVESEEKPRKKRHRHDEGCCNDDDGVHLSGDFTMGCAILTGYAVSSPYWLPRSILGDATHEAGYFARYPYQRDLQGFMVTDASMVDMHPWLVDDQYNWMLRTRGEYGTDFNDLSHIGGQVLLESASRWGVDTQFNWLTENLPAGVEDELWLGDCNLTYRFAQSPSVQMRMGLGVNWMADSRQDDAGFNFTYSGDWFPGDPWILSAEIDWGRLGRTGLFHGRATIGIQYHRVEVFTGYDYTKIGGGEVNGLVSGIRFWF